ncbi:MAG: glycosyltransferase family 4 protein [Gemmatimonadaceae bacterium]
MQSPFSNVVALYTTAESWRGASISFVHIARGLARHGFTPHVIATSPEIVDELLRQGIQVSQLPSERRMQAFRLRKRLSEIDAALVIVDRAHDLRVATRAVIGRRIGVINRYNLFRSGIPDDLLTRVAYRDIVKEVVFLSNEARDRVLHRAPFMRSTPSRTIYEGVDLEEFRPDRAAAERFRKTFRIASGFLLAVGALTAEKRYDFMFESLAQLGDEAPPLIVCGEGEEKERLSVRAMIRRVDVRFIGRLPQDQLIGAYNASLGLVHTGAVETFGLSVLEAMACGRPVVASAGGALPEVVGTHSGAGTLVDVDSIHETASAIRCLFSEPGQAAATGERARERARLFPLSAMEDSYAELVKRHLPGGAS